MHPLDSNLNGTDVAIFKFDQSGTVLLYSTYFGGSDYDRAYDIVVGPTGCVYVTGRTESSDLPMVNSFDSTYNGAYDVFVLKLNPTGNQILFSTYYGGSSYDYSTAMAIDDQGSVYVTGQGAGGLPTAICLSRRLHPGRSRTGHRRFVARIEGVGGQVAAGPGSCRTLRHARTAAAVRGRETRPVADCGRSGPRPALCLLYSRLAGVGGRLERLPAAGSADGD